MTLLARVMDDVLQRVEEVASLPLVEAPKNLRQYLLKHLPLLQLLELLFVTLELILDEAFDEITHLSSFKVSFLSQLPLVGAVPERLHSHGGLHHIFQCK